MVGVVGIVHPLWALYTTIELNTFVRELCAIRCGGGGGYGRRQLGRALDLELRPNPSEFFWTYLWAVCGCRKVSLILVQQRCV